MSPTQDNDVAKIDPDSYFAHYYQEPHPDDDLVLKLTCEALRAAEPAGPLDCLDVGTGANLYPLFAALPRASSLTAWEYAAPNIAWLADELSRDGMRPQWRHFWDVVTESYGGEGFLPEDPIAALKARTTLTQGSIFDLPERSWDAATMFFCAEAVSDQQADFDRACARFARSVRSGGTLVAAFLLNSRGYELDGRRYRVMNLSEDSLRATFADLATGLTLRKIGIVDKEVRSGYTGMALLTARSA